MEPTAIETGLSLRETGIALLRQAVNRELIGHCCEIASQFYREKEALIQTDGADAVQKTLPAGQKYLAAASSFTLEAVFTTEDCSRILHAVAGGPAGNIIEHALGGRGLCDLDQAWVRRQYAPHCYPSGHAPHTWHQDGALGYDFAAGGPAGPGPEALLPMLTCWLPLTPCGDDAPGLELISLPLADLLPPQSLADERLRSNYPPEKFHAPEMRPGNLVLFHSGVLHRTRVNPAMKLDRTSIELRLVAAGRVPSRLARDRFVRLD